MTATRTPETPVPEAHDPYKMRSLEQILALFDGGEFLTQLLSDMHKLHRDLLDYRDEHGPKGCKGALKLKVGYTLGAQGDINMVASVDFESPKKPPSSAAAFITDQGHMTLYSPMMRQMHGAPRDVTSFDPETGEIRDPS